MKLDLVDEQVTAIIRRKGDRMVLTVEYPRTCEYRDRIIGRLSEDILKPRTQKRLRSAVL